MALSRSGLPISSMCGICCCSACICFQHITPQSMPDEFAPFGIYHGRAPKTSNALGYGSPSGTIRDEVDGFQAGVSYLDTLEASEHRNLRYIPVDIWLSHF